jgi:hypothetical protein
MNSMVYTTSGGYMGVSFAMPIDVVMAVADQLRVQGQVVRGQLGLSVQELTVGLAHAFGLPGAGTQGALVSRVKRGSMAERAGLRLGDVILGFDARTDMSYAEIELGIAAKRAGDVAALSVWRAGAVKRIDVEVTARASTPTLTAPVVPRAPRGDRLGLVFSSQIAAPKIPGDDGAASRSWSLMAPPFAPASAPATGSWRSTRSRSVASRTTTRRSRVCPAVPSPRSWSPARAVSATSRLPLRTSLGTRRWPGQGRRDVGSGFGVPTVPCRPRVASRCSQRWRCEAGPFHPSDQRAADRCDAGEAKDVSFQRPDAVCAPKVPTVDEGGHAHRDDDPRRPAAEQLRAGAAVVSPRLGRSRAGPPVRRRP